MKTRTNEHHLTLKRVMTLALITLLCVLPLTSCGGKSEPIKSKVDHVYKAVNVDLDGDLYPESMFSSGDTLIMFASETVSREPFKTRYSVVTVDTKTAESKKEIIEEQSGVYVQAIAADSQAEITLLLQCYDEETGDESYALGRLNGGKIEIIRGGIDKLFEADGGDSDSGGRLYIQGLAVDKDGNIFLYCDYSILALDREFNRLFEIETSSTGYINSVGTTSDGRAYASYTDRRSHKQSISYIDTAKKSFGEEIQLPDTPDMVNARFLVGAGYDIYYMDGLSLRGFNAADGTPTELLNFVNSDVNPDRVQKLAVIDADTVACATYGNASDDDGLELMIMKRIPDDEIPEKYVIRLGYRSNSGNSVKTYVVRFNRASDEYRVELFDYAKYATSDDPFAEKRLESDLLSGDAPDIMVTSDLYVDNWIAQGAFADLNKLMKADKSFDRSKYFEGVLDAYTDEKGRMYEFAISFTLETLLANGSYVDFETWNAEKFTDFVSKLPKETYLMSRLRRWRAPALALSCSMDSFVNYKKATCSFDSEAFRKLLETLKSMPEMFSYYDTLTRDEQLDYESDPKAPYREGKLLLDDEDGLIYSLRDYVKSTVAFGEDVKVVYLGYPTNKSNGAKLRSDISFAISSKSLLSGGAWEFIKFASELKTNMSSRQWGFPINVEIFDAVCEYDVGSWNYITSNGTTDFGKDMTYEEVKRMVDSSTRGNGGNGSLVQITKEHVDGLKALISGSQKPPATQNKIFEIISEEADMYYSGAKSLDETVKIIQNRVSTYISEIS